MYNEAATQFEMDYCAKLSLTPANYRRGVKAGPAYNNARGFIMGSNGHKVLSEADIRGVKYGVEVVGGDGCLLKNINVRGRNASDPFGSGIALAAKEQITGSVYISSVDIDLMQAGPLADYSKANNEPISIEPGHALTYIRRAMLRGGEDAGMDAKSSFLMDDSFICSGHRAIRLWGIGATLANTTIIVEPGCKALWTTPAINGTPAQFSYYNCRFGYRGAKESELTSTLPGEMVEADGAPARIVKLGADPFASAPYSRNFDGFFAPSPTVLPVPDGYYVRPRAPTFEEQVGAQVLQFVDLFKSRP